MSKLDSNLNRHLEEIKKLNDTPKEIDSTKKYVQVEGIDTPEQIVRGVSSIIDQLIKLSCAELGIDTPDGKEYVDNLLYEYNNDSIPDISVDIDENHAPKITVTPVWNIFDKEEKKSNKYEVESSRDTTRTSIFDNLKKWKNKITGNNEESTYIETQSSKGFDIEKAIGKTLEEIQVQLKTGIEICHPWRFTAEKNVDAYAGSHGACAGCVWRFLQAGGIDPIGRPSFACNYKNGWIQSRGFDLVGTVGGGHTTKDEWTRNHARPGDIAIMDYGAYGHICMYDGQNWISDFRQLHMSPYSSPTTCYIFRYTGGKWYGKS